MKSIFDFDALVEKKSGTRQTTDLNPTLRLLTTNNRFQLNKLATQAMGVEVGDYVRIWENPAATTINEKFFIAQVPENTPGAAALTKANSANAATKDFDMCFNYSGTWGNMLQGFEGKDAAAEALVDSGLVIKTTTKAGAAAYRASKNIIFDLVDQGDQVIKSVSYHLFLLTNFTEVEANLKGIEGTDSAIESNVDAQSDPEEEANPADEMFDEDAQ